MTEESYTDDSTDVSQLERRLDEIEETIRKMLPSRREALGMGVAGLAGASLMSGTASAGSAQVGTIGDNSNLVDLVAEDVTITDTLNTASLSGAAAGEALLSDGSGNLTFGSGGGGILRNGSEIDYVALDVSNLPASTGSGDVALVTASDQYVEDNPPSGTPFDITSSQFSFNTSINAQDNSPQGIAFNNDGTRLFEAGFDNVGVNGGGVYQYELSTPFDLSTASFSNITFAPGGGREFFDVEFNNDGSKMYLSTGDNETEQLNLSSNFDISSPTLDTTLPSVDNGPAGIAFNDDGSKFFEAIQNDNKIYEYNLGTNFDLGTASLGNNINTQDQGFNVEDIAFNDDGSKLYEVGNDLNEIYQYDLTTPYDITTATVTDTISATDSSPTGITWNNNGSKLYEVGNGSDLIREFIVSTGGWEAF